MTTAYTQESRRLILETPLGKDAFLLVSFSGVEELSKLFVFQLELLSEKDTIAPKDIVGKNVSFLMTLVDGEPRYFNGFVRRFAYRGRDDRLNRYTMEVVPWLWFLTRRSDCRIFQKKTASAIIEEVFTTAGFSDFTFDVKGELSEREYCVQYRETDFDFVNRLMEEEGIYYFFQHENGKHTMVIANHKDAYKDCPENEVEYAAPVNAPQWTDMITSWEHQYEFRSGKYAQTDYNFQTPSAPMLANSPTVIDLDNIDKLELYDYPGKYLKKAEGEASAKVRMEEEEMHHDVVSASSKCRTFFAGGRFTITKHNSPGEENKGYVITSVHHSSSMNVFTPGGTSAPLEYSNSFVCIPDSVTFRPPRLTRKPIVHGAQTAVVVGPEGEDLHTDEFGRVKVKFHWDRYGKSDDTASCWIRVAQIMAGNKWGAMFLPRIGQEVVVDFLEGDPDQPLVTGRVYHAESMPPYDMTEFKTVSGIKTMSTPDGDGFNEIRFEDKKGEEQLFIHAEKNQDLRVKNDCFEFIGNNRHLIVTTDQLEKVDNNRHETVTNDHMEKIGKDRHVDVIGKEAKQVGGSQSLTVKGDVIEVFKGKQSTEVTGDLYIKGANVVIEGTSNLTLKVGGNSVVISSSGVVLTSSGMLGINGSPVLVNSGGSGAPGTGAAGSAVAPAAPTEPEEADVADPGEAAQVKAEQVEQGKGKYGAVPVEPHKPPQNELEKQKKPHWIEIKVVDHKTNEPITGERYALRLPSGKLDQGTTDDKGIIRVEGIEDAGDCEVTFPNLDGKEIDRLELE